MYPDFLCIGAQRAGTTWLYKNLYKHPDIWLPPIKELHYFNHKESNHLQSLREKLGSPHWQQIIREQLSIVSKERDFCKILWNLKFFSGDQTDHWYSSLFEPAEDQISGEITPDYIALSEETIKHIHSIMPQAKIIIMLRNPISRAWSYAFSHTFRGKDTSSMPTQKLVETCTKRYFFARGNYSKSIKLWESLYGEKRIFVGFFEEIKDDPKGLIRRLLNFLEVTECQSYLDHIERRKVYSFGDTSNIPHDVSRALAEIHYEDISFVSSRYGKYALQWLDEADTLLAKKNQKS